MLKGILIKACGKKCPLLSSSAPLENPWLGHARKIHFLLTTYLQIILQKTYPCIFMTFLDVTFYEKWHFSWIALSYNALDIKMNIVKYFQRSSSLVYLASSLEHAVNLMEETSFVFQTTLGRYLMKATGCPSFTWFRIIRQINRVH